MPQKSPQPQLQDPNLYEKLREQGDSKEKAARISNAAANRGRSSVGKSGGQSPPYEDWIVKDLMNRAKELGLHNYSNLHKEELIDLLRHH